ncbi:3'(2'),5'-bisphosphate nucleotidase CysQ [Bacteroidota bacterium]
MIELYNLAIRSALEAGRKIIEVYNSSDFEITEKSDQSPLTIADRAAHELIVSYLEKTNVPILSEEGKSIPYEERENWSVFWLVDPLDGTKEFIKRNDEFTVNIALIEEGKPVFGVVYAPALEDLYVGVVGAGSWLVKKPDSFINIQSIKAEGVSLKSISQSKEKTSYRVVASRSHLNPDTENYLQQLRTIHKEVEIVSKGSSLKLCMVASGKADEYPRLGPTMEWDVGAAHAVVKGAGKSVKIFGTEEELNYNKENLLNPYFLVI